MTQTKGEGLYPQFYNALNTLQAELLKLDGKLTFKQHELTRLDDSKKEKIVLDHAKHVKVIYDDLHETSSPTQLKQNTTYYQHLLSALFDVCYMLKFAADRTKPRTADEGRSTYEYTKLKAVSASTDNEMARYLASDTEMTVHLIECLKYLDETTFLPLVVDEKTEQVAQLFIELVSNTLKDQRLNKLIEQLVPLLDSRFIKPFLPANFTIDLTKKRAIVTDRCSAFARKKQMHVDHTIARDYDLMLKKGTNYAQQVENLIVFDDIKEDTEALERSHNELDRIKTIITQLNQQVDTFPEKIIKSDYLTCLLQKPEPLTKAWRSQTEAAWKQVLKQKVDNYQSIGQQKQETHAKFGHILQQIETAQANIQKQIQFLATSANAQKARLKQQIEHLTDVVKDNASEPESTTSNSPSSLPEEQPPLDDGDKGSTVGSDENEVTQPNTEPKSKKKSFKNTVLSFFKRPKPPAPTKPSSNVPQPSPSTSSEPPSVLPTAPAVESPQISAEVLLQQERINQQLTFLNGEWHAQITGFQHKLFHLNELETWQHCSDEDKTTLKNCAEIAPRLLQQLRDFELLLEGYPASDIKTIQNYRKKVQRFVDFSQIVQLLTKEKKHLLKRRYEHLVQALKTATPSEHQCILQEVSQQISSDADFFNVHSKTDDVDVKAASIIYHDLCAYQQLVKYEQCYEKLRSQFTTGKKFLDLKTDLSKQTGLDDEFFTQNLFHADFMRQKFATVKDCRDTLINDVGYKAARQQLLRSYFLGDIPVKNMNIDEMNEGIFVSYLKERQQYYFYSDIFDWLAGCLCKCTLIGFWFYKTAHERRNDYLLSLKEATDIYQQKPTTTHLKSLQTLIDQELNKNSGFVKQYAPTYFVPAPTSNADPLYTRTLKAKLKEFSQELKGIETKYAPKINVDKQQTTKATK